MILKGGRNVKFKIKLMSRSGGDNLRKKRRRKGHISLKIVYPVIGWFEGEEIFFLSLLALGFILSCQRLVFYVKENKKGGFVYNGSTL